MSSNRFFNLLCVIRIVSTVFFGLLCIGSVVLWIRSYWYAEGGLIRTFSNQHVTFDGANGRLCVWFEHSASNLWFNWYTDPNTEFISPDAEYRQPWFGLAFFWPKMTRLYIAHWLIVIVTALIAILPWLPRKFGIRELLITMAIISAVVGLITWVDTTF